MDRKDFVLALDQGTTSTRAIVFDPAGTPLASAQKELTQIYPDDGWVEHDPELIWSDSLLVCAQALEKAGIRARELAAMGITNQRETTILWDRESGRPIHNALVWQDRRTAGHCRELKEQGAEEMVREKTGLLLDPYFSATKIAWLLDNIPGARARAEAGRLAFGTVESFLINRLTGGASHLTDVTNASRTLLFNLKTQDWDPELLKLFRIPPAILPRIRDNAADFGRTRAGLLGAEVALAGSAGDQQAALIGQACFEPGLIKSTYGTGCFALMNTGPKPMVSANRLLTTVAYRVGGETAFALEGSIFIAGAALQWLRDGLGILDQAGPIRSHGLGRGEQRRGLPGPGLYRPGRALLGPGGPGGHRGPDPGHQPQPHRPGRPGGPGVPDPGPAGGHGRRRRAGTGPAQGGRRAYGQRLGLRLSGRLHRADRGAAPGHRDHGPGRGHPGRAVRGSLRLPGGGGPDLAKGPAL